MISTDDRVVVGNRKATNRKATNRKVTLRNKNIIVRDIKKNSEYIIKFFNERNKDVSNLKLQKLLYFLEAIYMYINPREKELYNEEFYAWNFGPVNDEIYKLYKENGSLPIKLNNIDEITINEVNKKYIEKLYDLFGGYSAFELITITHMDGSPWSDINKKYDGKIPEKVVVDKYETKEWFKTIVE